MGGDATQTLMCNVNVSCEPNVDCLFSDWSFWSACDGVKRRSRQIQQYGSGNGKFCDGNLKDISPCNPSPNEATPQECAVAPPENCQLSDWSAFSACSASCGGGQQTRSREMLQAPSNGGTLCESPLSQTVQCGNTKCPGPPPVDCEYGEWGDWAECNKCAGERTRSRQITTYPANGGKTCDDFVTEEVGACPRQCHKKTYCTWGEWQSWGSCTATCGAGKRSRRRNLGITDTPALPPPPASELMGLYSELQEHTLMLQSRRPHELSLAFCCGFLSLIVAFAGMRVFTTIRTRIRSREQLANSNQCVYHQDTLISTNAYLHIREVNATDVPLVGDA